MTFKHYFLLSFLGLALVGCEQSATDKVAPEVSGAEIAPPEAISPQGDESSEAAIRKTLAGAQDKLRISEERGFAWTGTADLLEQANQALENGELERASELSNALSMQASALVEQADYNDASWPEAIPK